jgi:mutator protein MutT
VTVVVAAVIEQDDAYLVTRRPEGTHLAGLWEFPGGKIDPPETHIQALRREIREELDADVSVGGLVFYTAHDYADRTVTLYFYQCRLAGEPRPLLGQQMRWVPRAELAALNFPPADAELIRQLVADQPSAGPATAPSRSTVPGAVKSRCT